MTFRHRQDERHKAYLVLILAVLGAYANSLWGIFQFSDYNVIVNYPVVHSWERWLQNALQGGIRPLLKLSYTLNWLSGPGPFGFHLFNIAIHGANALLVYEICRTRSSGWNSLREEYRPQASAVLLAALLFATHTIQTEAVTYISGRSASLMTLFYLASLLAYVYGIQRRNRLLQFLVSPVLFILAMAVKEVALSLPLTLLLWEFSDGRRSGKRILIDLSVHWGVLAGALVTVLTNRKYLELLLFSSMIRNLYDNLLSQINGISYLLSRLVLVHALNIDPDVPAISTLDFAAAVKLSVLALCAVFCFRKRKTRPWLLFGFLWFIIALLPSNSVIARLDVINERHFYLAGVGIFLAAGIEAALFCRRFGSDRRILPVSAGAIIVILACFTMLRNQDYRSEIALWESTVRYSPKKSRGYNNLGYAYEANNRHREAVVSFKTSLQLDPGNNTARKNMNQLDNFTREFGNMESPHKGGGL